MLTSHARTHLGFVGASSPSLGSRKEETKKKERHFNKGAFLKGEEEMEQATETSSKRRREKKEGF